MHDRANLLLIARADSGVPFSGRMHTAIFLQDDPFDFKLVLDSKISTGYPCDVLRLHY